MYFAPAAFHINHLKVWRSGGLWLPLVEAWLNHLAAKHGPQKFRTRSGLREVGQLCDEVLVLARWLAHDSALKGYQARLTSPGHAADALVRECSNASAINVQIVSAFDGESRPIEAELINSEGVLYGFGGYRRRRSADGTNKIMRPRAVSTFRGYEQVQAALVLDRIRRKSLRVYPPDFWLLISVEDSVFGLSSMPSLVEAARTQIADSTFNRGYLVGMGIKNEIIRIK